MEKNLSAHDIWETDKGIAFFSAYERLKVEITAEYHYTKGPVEITVSGFVQKHSKMTRSSDHKLQ